MMITNVHIRKVASYGEDQITLGPLQKVNFIFGENGSGKSTIAKCISNCDASDFKECSLEGIAHSLPKMLVYNKEFVDGCLGERIPGVFTLGTGTKDIQEKINELRKVVKSNAGEMRRLSEDISKSNTLVSDEEKRFRDYCWRVKDMYVDEFGKALVGTLNSKDKFASKCKEYTKKEFQRSKDELSQGAKTFLVEKPEKIKLVNQLSTHDLSALENFDFDIFKVKILGKDDVPIADLIKHLGNSDWVRGGVQYFKDNRCPFCQQVTPSTLKSELEKYFDDSYESAIEKLNNSIDMYLSLVSHVFLQIESAMNQHCEFFDVAEIDNIYRAIRGVHETNRMHLLDKRREPSLSIELGSLGQYFNQIVKIIESANRSITSYNTRIDNFTNEQDELIEDIWRFIGEQVRPEYHDHVGRLQPELKAIKWKSETLERLNEKQSQIAIEMNSYEADLTSTVHSKNQINSLLNSIGFDNFKIVDDIQAGYYRIERENGKIANTTLSEGERNFIAFLYFYQLIQGGIDKEYISNDRIVVFDDPVSSLDSKVLFVVSTLIRNLFCNDSFEKLNIIQIFLLTHNVYFHKEVSYLVNLKKLGEKPLKRSDVTFWIVRKYNGVSAIEFCKDNPIESSYQLLWNEIVDAKKNNKFCVTTCNSMRRILEYYFTVLGDFNFDKLVSKFNGDKKIVCRSLLSWIHDGSHNIFEDIDVGFNQSYVAQYLPVFEEIFDKTNQSGHFKLMMGELED